MKTGCDLKVELDFWVSQCNLSKTTSPMTFIDVCFGFVLDWSPIFHQSLTTTIPMTLNSTQIGWTGNKRSFKGKDGRCICPNHTPSWHQCTDSICPDSLTALHTNDWLRLTLLMQTILGTTIIGRALLLKSVLEEESQVWFALPLFLSIKYLRGKDTPDQGVFCLLI